MMNEKPIKNIVLVSIIAILLGTTLVPVVNTINIYDDSISNTNEIIQSSGDGNTLYVGGTGPNNYTKIQDAIDNASDGDTIFVYNGTYYENVMVDKTINLTGEDRNTTIIDGGGNGDVVYITADWVNITGFTVQNSVYDGIELNGVQHCHIENNIISNISNNSHGIELYSSSNNNISACTVYNNNYYGIRLDYSSNNNISACTVYNNSYGIWLYSSSNNIISACTVYNNDFGIWLSDSYFNVWLSDCYFNVIKYNNFINNSRHAGFYYESLLHSFSNCWNRNYWDRPRILPKPILGRVVAEKFPYLFPWLNFDWHPLIKPYTE